MAQDLSNIFKIMTMNLLKIVLIGMLLAGCKEESENLPENELLIKYEQTITQEIRGKDWTISFTDIEENSLCPKDVTCIWLGRMVVGLEINGVDQQLGIGDLTTNTEEEIATTVVVDGVLITLTDAYDTEEESTTKIKLLFEEAD